MLNFWAWCRVIQESTLFPEDDPVLELTKHAHIGAWPCTPDSLAEGLGWMQVHGRQEAEQTREYLQANNITQYHPYGIIVLYNHVLEAMEAMSRTGLSHFEIIHIQYLESLTEEETSLLQFFSMHLHHLTPLHPPYKTPT